MLKFWTNLFNRLRYKKAAIYEHLISISINKNHLLSNLRWYQNACPNLQIAPVLKSNAYGHGLLTVAEILRGEPAPFWVVDTYFEALSLRRASFNKPLLIIGYTPLQTILGNRLHELAFTVASETQFWQLIKHDPRTKIHLKFDTGMNRQGLPVETAEKFIAPLKQIKHLELVGVCSHLACSDQPTHPQNEKQISIWNELVDLFKNNLPQVKYFHLSATYGTPLADKIHANVLRLGLGLYGLVENELDLAASRGVSGRVANREVSAPPTTLQTPSSQRQAVGDSELRYNSALLPVLKMTTKIADIKTIAEGQSVGYDVDFTTARATTIAILPVGYYEALPRNLSDQVQIKIHDNFYPVIGKISMNIIVVDITGAENINIGDKAVIISDNPADKNCVLNLANLASTIPYEITCKIPLNIKRVIINLPAGRQGSEF